MQYLVSTKNIVVEIYMQLKNINFVIQVYKKYKIFTGAILL